MIGKVGLTADATLVMAKMPMMAKMPIDSLLLVAAFPGISSSELYRYHLQPVSLPDDKNCRTS
jgi:hypothetical protein